MRWHEKVIGGVKIGTSIPCLWFGMQLLDLKYPCMFYSVIIHLFRFRFFFLFALQRLMWNSACQIPIMDESSSWSLLHDIPMHSQPRSGCHSSKLRAFDVT
jgi:hypothetical protein